jgi:hypothetical protein
MNRKLTLAVALAVTGVFAAVGLASADSLGPIDFETYTAGNINGQQGWSKTGAYDAEVANVASFPSAAGFGFGTKALRISDAVTSGAFGDQTFSPSVANEAGEAAADSGGLSGGVRQSHFEASFQIGTTQNTVQPGLHLNVSPDRGDGARMSYLRFDDLGDNRVHVYFDDVTDPGPLGTVADFNERSVGSFPDGTAHTVRISMDFVNGPGNDVVQVFLDGALKATGGSWEDYYRFDPEQAGGGNKIPTTDDLIFAERGTNDPANAGKGFLIDNIGVASSPTTGTSGGGTAGAGGAGGVAGTVGKSQRCKKKKRHHAASIAKKRCKKHKKHH